MPRARQGIRENSEAPEYRWTIKDLPAAERPRERLLAHGAAVLSNAELLAIVLRTGRPGERVTEMASNLLARFRGLDGLWRASVREICNGSPGLGPAKATQVLAALELGRRLQTAPGPERSHSVGSPESVFALLRLEMEPLEQEHLKAVLLDNKHRVVDHPTIYKGSISGAVARMAEVFREAVRQNCPALVLAHNHPSGDPTPSSEDVHFTQGAIAAGRQLDISVLDHVIIGRGRFASLRREGVGLHWVD